MTAANTSARGTALWTASAGTVFCREPTMTDHVEIRGVKWDARTLAICIGWDALRLSVGQEPQHFTPAEICRWFDCIAASHRNPITVPSDSHKYGKEAK